MNATCTVSTNQEDSQTAGVELGRAIMQKLAGERPDAVIVFASSRYDYEPLLQGLSGACEPRVLIGSSSVASAPAATPGD